MKKFYFSLLALAIILGFTPATSLAFNVPIHQIGTHPGTLSIENDESFPTVYEITSDSNITITGEISSGETVTLNHLHKSFPNGGKVVIYRNVENHPYYRDGESKLYPIHPFKWFISKEMMELGGHIYTKEAYLPID